MENTDCSNILSGKNDISSSLWEVFWVTTIAMWIQVEILLRGSDFSHQLAQSSMNYFERCLSVKLHNTDFSEIGASCVSGLVDLSTI